MSTPATTTIAPGVRRLTVGEVFAVHLYLIDSEEGVIAFDAGIRGAGPAILAAAGGSLARVVLSHGHVDHRGAASELGDVPIVCHPDEVADVEGDAGRHYIDFALIENEFIRDALPRLNAEMDGGPVKVTGTIEAGDEVAGFSVIHTPGHAPGQIALYRPADGLLLAADAIYTVDGETGQDCPPRVPHPAVNWDTDVALESIGHLAALRPASAWAGHGLPVTEDTAGALERAAAGALAP